jgi:hypothetical protein
MTAMTFCEYCGTTLLPEIAECPCCLTRHNYPNKKIIINSNPKDIMDILDNYDKFRDDLPLYKGPVIIDRLPQKPMFEPHEAVILGAMLLLGILWVLYLMF